MLDLYKNIKKLRLENGWSQTALAHKVSYSDKSMIAKIEAGKIDLPQSKIADFAKVFGVTPATLMGWNDIHNGLDNKNIIDFHYTPDPNELKKASKYANALLESFDAAPENVQQAILQLLNIDKLDQ